jgi:hypothetical protein
MHLNETLTENNNQSIISNVQNRSGFSVCHKNQRKIHKPVNDNDCLMVYDNLSYDANKTNDHPELPSALEWSFELEKERMSIKLSEMLKLSQTPSFAEGTKNHFKIGADFQTSEDGFSMTQTSDIKVKPAAYYSIIPTTICQDLENRKSKLTKRRQATD